MARSSWSWRFVVGFAAGVALAFAAIFLGTAPTVSTSVAEAKTLQAEGVQVPLVSADLETHVVGAVRASQEDSCTLDAVTLHYAFRGQPYSARPLRVHVADRRTCADLRAAAAPLYAPGVPVLVDPAHPSQAALAQFVPAEAGDGAYAAQGWAVGWTLLVIGLLLGIPVVVSLLRRRRTPAPATYWRAGWQDAPARPGGGRGARRR